MRAWQATIFSTVVVGFALAVLTALWWFGSQTPTPGDQVQSPASPPLRIGLIPERDIFEQRRRYRALADYMSEKLERPVELVTSRTYQGILDDFRENRVDAAFLGSMMTVLTVDRLDAIILAKPRLIGIGETYRGVIFVADDSPARSVDDLDGYSIAMVRATTAGNLFPVYELARRGLLPDGQGPRIVWVGTHDEVILEVLDGQAEVGALKDHRLDVFLRDHPERKVRRLALSSPVPENALVLRRDLEQPLAGQLRYLLLEMVDDPAGQSALRQFGAERFLPCTIDEYQAIYQMVDSLAEHWNTVGVDGPPPRRPAKLPIQTPGGN